MRPSRLHLHRAAAAQGSTWRTVAFHLLAGLAALSVAACSGSGTKPPATLTVSPSALTVTAGDGPSAFTATLANATDAIAWSQTGPGTHSATSGTTTSYTPPATVLATTTATLTATAASLTASAVITVIPPQPAGDPYAYTAPPATGVPAGLDPATWVAHHRDDLLPYWTMDAAKGAPVGNFPTYRRMDGAVRTDLPDRKPRMMGRQVFTYSVGFLLTGDEALLDLARAGNRWLLDHASDTVRGGWHADLDAAGNPTGSAPKLAQDMAYDVMGPASFFFVTADQESEAAVLQARDLLFDPSKYWDAANGRIRDGMDPTLTSEAYMGAPGSWELVAQLDPVTAFLLLTQPVLTDPARRDQVLGDLRTLASRMRTSFWRDGFFWGATGVIGNFNGQNHNDFGHMLKAYWAVLQIDKRLADRPHAAFLQQYAPAALTLAYDAPNGRWAKYPTSASTVAYGSDWWAYAESDQLAATLALHYPAWIAPLGETARHFREDYVDRTRPAREVVPSVNRTGGWVYPWPDNDTAKCNQWKSGFHAAEHALVMYLFSHWLQGTPAPLYFAFPAGQVAALAANARPYTFPGKVVQVEDLGALAGDATRHKVRVSFDELR